MHSAIGLTLLLLSATASADEAAHPMQIQADVGLAVVAVGVERLVAPQLAIQAEAFITGTYFLPWFDLGADTRGFGGGVRATWLEHPDARGLYGVALVRLSGVHTDTGDTFLMTEVGLAAGYAFPITQRLELRLGVGVVLFHGHGTERSTGVTDEARVNAPMLQLDAVLGYRL